MAEIRVAHDGFSLSSKWNCRTVYSYNSTGSFNSSTNTVSGLTYDEETVRFPVSIPAGAKVKSAKVYASNTSGLYGGKLEIAGIRLEDDGFVALEAPDFSAGYLDVVFKWTAYTDGSTGHGSNYPSYNGSSSQAKTYSHTSTTKVSGIELVVEYQQGGIIYRAVNGALVPYQLYRAEDGVLVPYQIQHAEDGALAPYGG